MASNVVAAMRRLRTDYIPDIFTGVPDQSLTQEETTDNVDFFELAESYLPIVVEFVLAVSYVLLTVALRSLVVHITAIIMNLLSVGVAYGLMVLVFQSGIGPNSSGSSKWTALPPRYPFTCSQYSSACRWITTSSC